MTFKLNKINIMPNHLKRFAKLVNHMLSPIGIEIQRKKPITSPYPIEASVFEIEIMESVLSSGLTMVSPERLWAAISATRYSIINGIQGDIVECGVWKGGCSIAMATVIKRMNADKKIYLYDTFAGMTRPTAADTHLIDGSSATEQYEQNVREDYCEWSYSGLDQVKREFEKRGLIDYAIFVQGDVLQTLSKDTNIPPCIAVLRLDTDWYESTRQELQSLYPRLKSQGVLLIDDYGCWAGSKRATDEFFDSIASHPISWVIDRDGRGFIKP